MSIKYDDGKRGIVALNLDSMQKFLENKELKDINLFDILDFMANENDIRTPIFTENTMLDLELTMETYFKDSVYDDEIKLLVFDIDTSKVYVQMYSIVKEEKEVKTIETIIKIVKK